MGKLRDRKVQKTYQTEIRNRFAVLLDQQEMDLYQFNQTLVEAGKKALGPRRRKKEQWITTITWKKTEDRKVLSRVVLNRFTTTVDPRLRKEQAG